MADYGPQNRIVLDRVKAKLTAFKQPDARPLMVAWELIIREDNRRGVLAGTDKDGNPMAPVTYRPKGETINIRSAKASQLRHGQRWNRQRDLIFRGLGPWQVGLHNNLTADEYERLSGPPLAPRGQFSRVISNLLTGHEPLNPSPETTYWAAFGYWDEVAAPSSGGGTFDFLHVHFEGLPLGRNGPSKKRDLRGVRPEGRIKLWEAYEAWKRDHIRSTINA